MGAPAIVCISKFTLYMQSCRQVEDAARVAGYQQAKRESDVLLKEHQNKVTNLDSKLQHSKAEFDQMSNHYIVECRRLCTVIDELRRVYLF